MLINQKEKLKIEMDEKYTSNMEWSRQVLSVSIKIPKRHHTIHSNSENNYKTKR
jgi:hypothetical protein